MIGEQRTGAPYGVGAGRCRILTIARDKVEVQRRKGETRRSGREARKYEVFLYYLKECHKEPTRRNTRNFTSRTPSHCITRDTS
jgi:hypothetical protein